MNKREWIQKSKQKVAAAATYFSVFFKWLLLSLAVGALCGVVGTAFHTVLEWAGVCFAEQGVLLWLLPVGGLALVALYRGARLNENFGTNEVISSVRQDGKVPLRLAPLIFIGTTVTHLLGGSAGREGAALQLGGSLGSGIGRLARLNTKDLHVVTLCGMSAVFAAVFGTPLAAAVISIEMICVGWMYYFAIFPCMVASVTGYGVSLLLGAEPLRFMLPQVPAFSALSAVKTLGLAVLFAVVSVLFCQGMHSVQHLLQKYIKNAYLRVCTGGVVLVVLTLLLGSRAYNGAGMDGLQAAVAGQALPWAFLLKLLFTAITIGAGYKGGEIVPAFFVGATFGCVAAGLLGLPAGFGAALGMIAVFCGVTNCPITALLLAAELFSGQGMLYFGIAVATSFLLSGYFSLYSAQKFAFSKFTDEQVDISGK